MKVSVIAPIYGVEKFIERCARSLMEQTLHEVEFIFVDDASPDRSVAILRRTLADYPERANQVRILTHEQNKGLPAARNTGLEVAQGEYVFHCDSDDFVDREMLAEMYEVAKSKDVDIAWADFYDSYASSERHMVQPSYNTPHEALCGILCGRMKYNVWNKLVRRSLYEKFDIRFPAGRSMGEDMTMIKLFANASSVAYIPKPYYHYVKWNASSMTARYTQAHLEALERNVLDVIGYLSVNYNRNIEVELACFQLEAKWVFLISNRWEDYRRWSAWFTESHPYIWKNKYVSFRVRLVEWLAAKKQYWLIWVHYYLVIKLLYSIIYK